MTIDGLNILIGADDTALGRGLASAISKLQNFAAAATATAAQAGQGLEGFVNQAGAAGSRAADQFAAGFSSVNAKLSSSFKELDKRREELEKGYGRLGETFKSVGQNLTAGVTLPLVGLGAASVAAFGSMEALEKGFFAVYKGAGNANEELAKTKELAKLPGLGLEEVVKGSVRLQAVGISAEQARKSIEAFGNAIATTGGGKSEFDRVTVQLAQLSAKGKVLSQDLRPIIEAAPVAASALQKLYGTIDPEAISAKLAATGKNSQDFIAGLTEELGKLDKVAGGTNNTIENFADSVKKSLSSLGGSIVKSIGLNELADKIGGAIEQLGTSFAGLPSGTQKAIIGLAGVAAAIGPLSLAIGSVIALLPTLGAGFAVLTGPVGLTIAAVAAGTALIITNWDALSAYFKTDAGKPFVEIVGTIGDSLKLILGLVSDFANSFGGLFSAAFKSALALVGPILSDMVKEVNNALKTINSLVKLASADNAREWAAGYDSLEAVTKTKSTSLLGMIAALTKDAIDLYTKAETLIAGINLVPKQKGMTIAQFFANDFAAQAANEWEKLAESSLKAAAADEKARLAAEQHKKTLGGLKEALSAAKGKLDTLVGGTAEFDATKAEIVRLTELIRKLEDTGKAAKKASDDIAKAFAEIRSKVSAVNTRVRIGVELNYDGLFEKVKILQDGIKTLTDKGVSGSSPALQGLVRQLAGVRAQIEQVKASMRRILTSQPTIGDGGDIYTIDVARIQEKLKAAKLTAELQFNYDNDLVKLKQAIADASNTAKSELTAAGVPAATPGATAISDGARETKTAAFDATSLQEYLQAMKDISAEEQVFGAGFNASAAAIQVTSQRLLDLIRTGQQGTPEFAKLTEQMKELKQAADWSDLTNSVAQSLSTMLADIGNVLGEQLAEVLVNGKNGGDALADMFQGVLGVFGGFLVNLGTMLVQYGLLTILAEALGSNPLTAPAAIAVGLAAIAVGALFKAGAKKGPSGGGGSSGYSPSTSAGSSPKATGTTGGKTEIVVKFEPVELRADGTQLRSVMKVDSYRLNSTR